MAYGLGPVTCAMALFVLSTVAVRAEEPTEAQACQAQLADLGSILRGAPMGAMGRPGQSPVKLNDGRWYSVSDIDSIRQDLNRAARLCQEGKTHDGLIELNQVRRHLDLAAVPHLGTHEPSQ